MGVTFLSSNKTQHEVDKLAFQSFVQGSTLQELVAEFFLYLDYTEESDSGSVFNPVTISSVRVGLSGSLNILLEELRKRARQ